MYALTRPMNMAVMAVSPKPLPAAPSFFGVLRRERYFLLKKIENTMPHMMQTPIKRAIVVNACAVIAEAESPGRPTASAAASATCVS